MPTIETLTVSLEASTKKFSTGMKLATGLLAGAGLAVAKFADDSLKAFEPFEKAAERVAYGLKGIAPPAAAGAIEDWAKRLASQTGIIAADTLDLTGKVEVLGKTFFQAIGPSKAPKLIEDVTLGIENMAAATGKSASMLTRALVPAILNTPAKAIPLLQKLGVVTAAQAAHFTAMAKAGQTQALSLALVTALTQRYSGAAAATATPLEKLKAQWNSIEVTVGSKLMPVLVAFANWAVKNPVIIDALAAALATLAAAYVAVKVAALAANLAMGPEVAIAVAIIAAVTAMTLVYNGAAEKMGKLGVAMRVYVGVLTLGASESWVFTRKVAGAFAAAAGAVAHAIGVIVAWVAALPGRILGAIASLPGRLSAAASNAFHRFLAGAVSVLGAILAFARSVPVRIAGAIIAMGGYFYSLGIRLMQNFLNGLLGMAGRILSWVENFAKSIAHKMTFGLVGSPNLFTYYLGKDLMTEMARGVREAAPKALAAMGGAASGLQQFSVAGRPSLGRRLQAVGALPAGMSGGMVIAGDIVLTMNSEVVARLTRDELLRMKGSRVKLGLA